MASSYKRETKIRPVVVEKKAAKVEITDTCDIFAELQNFINDLAEKKAPYIKYLTGSDKPNDLILLMWERDFWRDKYFKLKGVK